MEITTLEIALYAVVSLVMSALSGITGGGLSLIMTPLLIAIGLSPAQAVATGKIPGLSTNAGSLHGMRKIKPSSKKRVITIVIMALIVGIIAPFFIRNLNEEFYKTTIGFLLLLMIPVLIIKKVGLQAKEPTALSSNLGYICLALALALQAIFAGGMGMLVPIVMMSLMGMTALDATVTKRYANLVMNVVIILGVLWTGLIVWQIALVGLVTCFIGSSIGSRIAVKKGDSFVMTVMIGLILVSSVWLIFG
jgi:uncharacterized protein